MSETVTPFAEPVEPAVEPAAEPVEPTAEQSSDTPVAAAKPRTGPGLRAAAAVVAAVLLGVGIGEGILAAYYDGKPVTFAAPATPAATAGASAGPAYGAKSDGTHFGSMRDLLLPVPVGYLPGPDAGAYGNDTELTDDQRKAWIDDEVSGLPQKLQDAMRKGWQDVRLKGAGVRTFAATDHNLVVTFWLLQYHQDAVKADNAWSAVLGSDSGLFRQGPQVTGHDEAHCYLPAAAPGDKIDQMDCSAALGDLRVEMKVEGVAPLPKDLAVTLFTQQLNRLALPGASV